MASFYLIIISLILGKICSFSERFPKQTAQALNGFVLYISLPAIVILKVPELIQEFELSLKLLAPMSMAWISSLSNDSAWMHVLRTSVSGTTLLNH